MEQLIAVLASLLTITGGAVVDHLVGAPIQRFLQARYRSMKRVQRVRWPDDARVFEESWHIYCTIHRDLRDNRASVRAWLQEDATTETAEELYLVARRHGTVRAILYATLNLETDCVGPRCFVWNVVADPNLRADRALELGKRLCEKLEWWVVEKTGGPTCDYYFETVGTEDEPETEDEKELERRRRYLELLAALDAQRVGFPYVIADASEACDQEEEMEARLFYRGDKTRELVAEEMLDDIYGFYFWQFMYGTECPTFRLLARRVEYFLGLFNRVRKTIPGDTVKLVSPEDADAWGEPA